MGRKTSNAAVLGEVGRLPLYPIYLSRCIKYWINIGRMGSDRYPKSSYDMLKSLDDGGRKTWATNVKNNLYRYGFGIVWLNGNVGDIQGFMSAFKERVSDECRQSWSQDITESPKLVTYSLFKSMLEPERYLQVIFSNRYRAALANFRCSCHRLEIEVGRHKNTPKAERICAYCAHHGTRTVESEYHFIMICPSYEVLRNKYIDNKYKRFPSICKFVALFNSSSAAVLTDLAAFIFHASKKRELDTL